MNPGPAEDELRVSIIPLDRSASASDWELLDDVEHERADRFVSTDDRARFVVAHACVRRILFERTGIAAQRLRIRADAHGKPYLEAHEGSPSIRFNLSHSRSLAALAVHPERDVGIDIEHVGRISDAAAIARNYFHPDEAAWLEQAFDDQKDRRFLALWTMKEAFIKASGIGLSRPLDSFCVIGINRQTELVIRSLDLAPGYCGAVAYRPPTLPITVTRYSPMS